MLVDSIAQFKNNNNKVIGVDTNKVLAKPIVKKVNAEIKPQFFANNAQIDTKLLKSESKAGKLLNIFA